jgi:uncharacterized protein (TIGR02421 family)
MSAASRIPLSSLRRALQDGVPLRGRSEGCACRFHVSKLVPYVAIAPHGGHKLRRDMARLVRLDDRARRHEESPGTDRLVSASPIYVAGLDSRLEYDLELPEEAPTFKGANRIYRSAPTAEVSAENVVRHREVLGVMETLVQAVLDRFGACLVFEITAVGQPPRSRADATFDMATSFLGEDRARFKAEIDAWRAVLSGMRILGKKTTVSEDAGLAMPGEVASRLRSLSPKVLVLPTAIRRVYMDERSELAYPAVVRSLRRDLGRAMAKVATTFARARTAWRPPHSAALRAGDIPEIARKIDAALTEVSCRLRLLRYVNPINAEPERQKFVAAKGDYAPRFRYRPLEFDPAELKRKLYQVRVEEIEDPELERLYAAKRRELDLKVDLLAERGTPDFLLTSLKLYGRPEGATLKEADTLLGIDAVPEPHELTARDVQARLEREVALYVERDPTFKCGIRVKRGLASRAITLERRVELRAESAFSVRLAEGLAAHEVGVHALTTHNGAAQPLEILRYGLPGSRRTQEGLAVFSEFRAGALTPSRLKTLGLRTRLVGLLAEGATFVDAVRAVQKSHALELDDAYELVFRVYRGGGLTKDGVYLSGFLDVVKYWLAGKDLRVLVAGKVSLENASIVRDLVLRGVLRAPRLLPRFLDDEAGLAANRVVFDLLRSPLSPPISIQDVLSGGSKNGHGP